MTGGENLEEVVLTPYSSVRGFRNGLVGVAVAASLVGCPTVDVEPETLQVEGVFVHEATGMEFPSALEPFTRVDVTRYDAKGHRVGVGYNLVSVLLPVIVTVYVKPAPRVISIGSPPEVAEGAREVLFQDYWEARKDTIPASYDTARLLQDDELVVALENGELRGRRAVFELTRVVLGIRGTDASFLYVFQAGKWLLEYRITCPRLVRGAGEEKALELVRKLGRP